MAGLGFMWMMKPITDHTIHDDMWDPTGPHHTLQFQCSLVVSDGPATNLMDVVDKRKITAITEHEVYVSSALT